MRTFSIIALILSASSLWADTYVYRVNASLVSKASARTTALPLGSSGVIQPYMGTSILNQGDTNYYRVTITPNDGQDPRLETRLSGVDLQMVLRLDEDGNFRRPIDNTGLYPSTHNWAIRRSSP